MSRSENEDDAGGAIGQELVAPARGSISLRGLRKTFTRGRGKGEFHALDGVDLDIPGGSIFGVIGRSGAGKSTLLRTINLLAEPDSGEVLIDGVPVTGARGAELAEQRRKTGMIFQHFSLMTSKTVWQNVALPLRLAGTSEDEIDRRVAELIALVGLVDQAHAYPAGLSGGQKQRVAIARALVHDPEILLSDEATSALDPETTRSILGLIRRINRDRGVTVVLISHEMSVVEEIADSVAIIDGGRVVEQGPTWRIFSDPAHPVTAELVRAARRDRLGDIEAAVAEMPRLARHRYVIRFDGDAPIGIAEVSRLAPDIRVLKSDIRTVQGHSQGYLVFETDAEPAITDRAPFRLEPLPA
jgi:D-methionine transport system ATP-binding protein